MIVDTTMPRIERLAAQLRGDGALQIAMATRMTRISTPVPGSFEVQLDASDTWQPVAGLAITRANGQADWQPPAGDAGPRRFVPPSTIAPATRPPSAPRSPPRRWTAPSPGNRQPCHQPQRRRAGSRRCRRPLLPQPQPPAPPQFSRGQPARSPARHFVCPPAPLPSLGDRVTSYGNPPGRRRAAGPNNNFARRSDKYRVGNESGGRSAQLTAAPAPNNAGPNFAPLEPYREATQPFRRASLTRLPAVDGTLRACRSPRLPNHSSPQQQHAQRLHRQQRPRNCRRR